MKRFIIFAGMNEYPQSGMLDCKMTADSFPECRLCFMQIDIDGVFYEWAQCLDTEESKLSIVDFTAGETTAELFSPDNFRPFNK